MIAASLCLLHCGCGKKAETETAKAPQLLDYQSLRADVVRQLQAGVIRPDTSGVALLPDQVKAASTDGQVYVSTSSADGLLVAFKALPGKGFGNGFLYCEKTFNQGTQKIQVGPFDLTLAGRIDDHWYQVRQ